MHLLGCSGVCGSGLLMLDWLVFTHEHLVDSC